MMLSFGLEEPSGALRLSEPAGKVELLSGCRRAVELTLKLANALLVGRTSGPIRAWTLHRRRVHPLRGQLLHTVARHSVADGVKQDRLLASRSPPAAPPRLRNLLFREASCFF